MSFVKSFFNWLLQRPKKYEHPFFGTVVDPYRGGMYHAPYTFRFQSEPAEILIVEDLIDDCDFHRTSVEELEQRYDQLLPAILEAIAKVYNEHIDGTPIAAEQLRGQVIIESSYIPMSQFDADWSLCYKSDLFDDFLIMVHFDNWQVDEANVI